MVLFISQKKTINFASPSKSMIAFLHLIGPIYPINSTLLFLLCLFADGRDHTACCAREGVIDLCIDVCRGVYTPSTGKIKNYYSCDAFTERALACVAKGVGEWK